MVRTGFLLLAMALSAAPAFAKEADPNPASLAVPPAVETKAKELVRVLANPSYGDREQATRELKELGRLALPALREALANSSSAEVQLRCELLLPKAQAEDFKARVDCFLADAKGQYDHQLPGAKEFFAVTGTSDASKTLFRSIVLSPNQNLLMGLSGTKEDLAKVVSTRRNQFRSYFGSDDGTGRPDPKAVDILAILFAESHLPESTVPRVGSLSTAFLNSPELRAGLDAAVTKEVYTAVVVKWVETRELPQTLYSAMTMSTNLKLPTAIVCAKKLLATKTGPGLYKGYAMTAIAKEGKPEHIALLEPLLKDNTVITTRILPGGGNRRTTIQVRDTALALLLLMQKKEPTDFGFTSLSKTSSDIAKMQYSYHYFDDTDMDVDKKRDAAFKKYEEWQAEEGKKKKKD